MAPDKKRNRTERKTNPPNARGRVPAGRKGVRRRAGRDRKRKLGRQQVREEHLEPKGEKKRRARRAEKAVWWA